MNQIYKAREYAGMLRVKVQEETGITVSIGAAQYNADIMDYEGLIKRRDCAVLYMKKEYLPAPKRRCGICG